MKKFNWFVVVCSQLTLFFVLCLNGVQTNLAQQYQSNIPNALECGQFGLGNASFYRIPSRAGSLVTADFNNDSIPDIAAMMPDTNSIAVALGDNQTGFAPAREFVVGVSPQEAAVGDFNRDGEIDLAVTTALDDYVTILHGDGQGNFKTDASYPVGGAPRGVQTADFNRDGWLDLVVGNTENPNVGLTILLGTPNGMTPANPATIVLNGSVQTVRVGDFNNDGNPDIIVVATNSSGSGLPSSVRLFYGNGSGVFSEALTISLGEMYALTTADFNSDGFEDFAVFGQPDLKVRIYLNNRNGGFNSPIEFPATGSNFSLQSTLIAGDLNGDGKTDLALGSFFLINDGMANFTVRQNGEVLNGKFVLADFNGDGIIDQASPSDVSDLNGTPPSSTFAVSYGTGNARFTVPVSLPVSGTTEMVTGDFNNDGRDDIVFGNGGFSFTQLQIAFQNADGTFNTQQQYVHGGVANNYTIVAAADFDNDGNLDIATNINWARSITILKNNGNGQFTNTNITLNSGGFSFQLEYFQPGDFNNDGYTDFITVNQQSFILVLNNGSSGGFTVQQYVQIGSSFEGTKRIVVGDFNGDGNKDFVVARTNTLYHFRGNGNGAFQLVDTYQMPLPVSYARGTTLSTDNRTDIVVTTGGNSTIGGAGASVFIFGEVGRFSQTNYTLAGSPGDILFGDFNTDSSKDFAILNSPNNHLTIFNGNGTLNFTQQNPFIVSYNPTAGTFGNFNQDQKPDLVLGGRFSGNTRLFYNNTPRSPCLSVNDVSVTEGNSGTSNASFTVSLSATSAQNVTVDYKLIGRSATPNSDFNNQTGTLIFPTGTLTQTISLPIPGDTKDEIDETFQIILSNPSNASLTDDIGIGTILDDDQPPSVSISDVSMLEGTSANPTRMIFNLNLSAPTGRKAKVAYQLIQGTAQSGTDFLPYNGTAIFNDNQSMQQIAVSITADAYVEPDETFILRLTNPSNLAIADNEANATILNDDFGGTVQLESAAYTVSETTDTATVTVNRTDGAAAGIVVMYSTTDGTATAGRDYIQSTGKIIFNAGDTSKTITVPILDDAIDEPNVETVNISLSNISGGAVLGNQSVAMLNITDDDPPPALTVSNQSVIEGNSGTSTAMIEVRLLAVSALPVSVNFITADGTATSPADYVNQSGVLNFAPGETLKTVSIIVNGDTQLEPNENFWLNLISPANAILQNSQAVVTITNDDSSVRRAPADFDGDGRTDVSIFRPNSGQWWLRRSTNEQVTALEFGLNSDKIVPSDFTGDGKTDVAFWRPTNGNWYILRSEDFTFYAFPFGASGDIPAPGDFDGDGRSDATVFRPSTATWYIMRSSDNQVSAIQFGFAEDQPVVADYDGDGKTDIAIYRPTVSEWWIQKSSGGTTAVQFGTSGDQTVPGDYTGDGKTDVAFWRPSTSQWFVLRSEDNSYYGFQFGTGTDKPVPGDYDGDGRFDVGVFRPSANTWYVNQTSAGVLITNFGASNDLPLPAAYIRQ